MTFGAGGSTREGTLETVLEIHREGLSAAPHISCIGTSRESVRALLDGYRGHGIRHLVALRGDLPSGLPAARATSATPTSWSNSSAPKRATGSTSKSRPIPSTTRRRARRRRSAKLQAQGQRRRQLGDHAVLLQPDAYSRFRRRCDAHWAATCRSWPASCRSSATRSSRAFPTRAAPRFRAGSAGGWRASATTGVDPGVRAGRGDRPVRAPARGRRARAALLHAEPGRGYRRIVRAPALRRALSSAPRSAGGTAAARAH